MNVSAANDGFAVAFWTNYCREMRDDNHCVVNGAVPAPALYYALATGDYRSGRTAAARVETLRYASSRSYSRQ